MMSPYAGLPPRAFWRSGVTEQHPLRPGDIYTKKFAITKTDRIATAGSCFAQHIARRLRGYGYDVIDEEPPPPGLTGSAANDFGFEQYSARYGNIYTTRQLWDLAREAQGKFKPADAIWGKKGRFYDALRPSVEPNGLDSPEQVREHRAAHLEHVRRVFEIATVFIFTFGLTEAWQHRASGTVYPTAPGTIAGSFDPAVHAFKNFEYREVLTDFMRFRRYMQNHNPKIRFLVTVSPVPLTATASGDHVLPATIYSKSVLRAVAGHLSATCEDVDYFPSYEIIAGMPARGFFYESNLRSVAEAGVDTVMQVFFSQHAPERPDEQLKWADPAQQASQGGLKRARLMAQRRRAAQPARPQKPDQGRIVCEEELLEAFGQP